jgi:hypothetical protein
MTQLTAQKTRTFTKELLSEGLWTNNKGNLVEIRQGDLQAIIQATPRDVGIKLGHTSEEFNNLVADKLGLPAIVLTGDDQGRGQSRLGCAGNFRVVGDRLLADITLPEALADMVDRTMLADVSGELKLANPYGITAVALLGVERAAIGNLRGFLSASDDGVILLSKMEGRKMVGVKGQIIEMLQGLLKSLQGIEGDEEAMAQKKLQDEEDPDKDKKPFPDEEDKQMAVKAEDPVILKLQAQVDTLVTRFEASESENKTLRLAARETHFTTLANDFPHIQDKAVWGKQMATLEMSAPGQIEGILAAHTNAAAAQKQSALFQKVSVNNSLTPVNDDHPFMAKVKEVADAEHLDLSQRKDQAHAFTKASEQHRELFLDYENKTHRN